MQSGGVTTTDAYRISGRVFINGTDIGVHVQTVSMDRDIPSGLPGDSSFTSATGQVTAVWGDDVSDRVDHPWSVDPLWPPKPNARVEVRLSDGTREWTQFKGVVVDPSGSTSTRVISFGVRDNYRSLDRLVTIPALSNAMPTIQHIGGYRWVGMESTFITDMLLRAAGRYCTPPPQSGFVVSATMQGSTWPERGTIASSEKYVPDGGTESFPNWQTTHYGLAVQNVSARYHPNILAGTPGGGRITRSQFELTQEVIQDSPSTTWLRARFSPEGGRVGLIQLASGIQARYYPPGGGYTTLITAPKEGAVRATTRFRVNGSVLTAELRTLLDTDEVVQHGVESMDVGTDLDGVLQDVYAHGEGTHGAFQAAFATTPFTILDHKPNAVIQATTTGRNSFVGVKPQVSGNVLELLNEQADAEFAQWWIDEHDVLRWWQRGLLAQQPIVGALTSADHVKELSWSHDHDSARRKVHVKYRAAEVTHRWRTNLTLWQNRSDTLDEGDTSEIFINVPDDEIWLGVDTNPDRYGQTVDSYTNINRARRSIVGGIAVDGDGNERRTNSVIVTLRQVNDEAYVFDHRITALAADEQVALEFPSDDEPDPHLWSRWYGEKLPILRGKKLIRLQEETSTSDITGDDSAPDYTHDYGWWIQLPIYAGQTADFAAASLTQPKPRIDGLDIMPVLALQAGDRVRIDMPDVAELTITGVVTSNRINADLSAGTVEQSIGVMPTNVGSLAHRWKDFGQTFSGKSWQQWAQETSNTTWTDFGNNPMQ